MITSEKSIGPLETRAPGESFPMLRWFFIPETFLVSTLKVCIPSQPICVWKNWDILSSEIRVVIWIVTTVGFNLAFERREKWEVSQIHEIYFGWPVFPIQVKKQVNKLGQQCSLPNLLLLNWDPCTECSTAKQFFCCHRKSRGKVLNRNNDLTSSSLIASWGEGVK